MWIKPDVFPVIAATGVGVAALFYAAGHSLLDYEDVHLSRKQRQDPIAELTSPKRYERLGHRHVERSFFRRGAESHDPNLYDPHLHRQPAVFGMMYPWKM